MREMAGEISARVRDLKSPEPLDRSCRRCGARYQTRWRSKWLCDPCCSLTVRVHTEPVAMYQVPVAYAAHGLAAPVQAAADESWLLVMSGPTGTGKTCQAHHLLAGHPAAHAVFAQVGTLAWDWQDRDTRDRLTSVSRLVLDDVGRRLTDGISEALCLLLDHRGARRMPTIVTTMQTRQELTDAHPALGSRLAAGRWLRMGGPDRRLGRT